MKKRLLLVGLIAVASACAVAQSKMKETESGLKYVDHQLGDGTEAVAGNTVDVHYTGWLYVDGVRTNSHQRRTRRTSCKKRMAQPRICPPQFRHVHHICNFNSFNCMAPRDLGVHGSLFSALY